MSVDRDLPEPPIITASSLTLLPPAIRHCAIDSLSSKVLLGSQAALQQCVISGGANIQLQRLSLLQTEGAHSPDWALEAPCKTVVVKCAEEARSHQLVLDPCSLALSRRHPAAKWTRQEPFGWAAQKPFTGLMLVLSFCGGTSMQITKGHLSHSRHQARSL
ncbi:hypothetical protein WJX74_000734 [Apatococcus lobatus]|uniref:Uncharacterized protein n=1 Tax=Apatococcus lobatus TaxID=904363 RepID=A0AAW1RKW5_9CHLO